MIFRHHKTTGEGHIQFSWKERFLILFKGHLNFNPISFKHVLNTLAMFLFSSQENLHKNNPEIAKLQTNDYTDLPKTVGE